jgi:uncharacterized protein YndB with AHSA1/START domain
VHTQAETYVARAPAEVFDYISHGQWLPEYVDDFAWVKRLSDGPPREGTEYAYKMDRGAEGTFKWSEFEPPSRLAWEGPPVKAAPASTMAPAGYWELREAGHSTHVTLAMTPHPGGFLKVLAPLLTPSMRKGNAKALGRLKARLEGSTPTE